MPYIHVQVSSDTNEEAANALLPSLSIITAEVLGKSENYVMAAVSRSGMRMSGSDGKAVFIDLRSIGGLSEEANRALSERFCAETEARLGIPKERVYLNFTDVERDAWGWAGRTFG